MPSSPSGRAEHEAAPSNPQKDGAALRRRPAGGDSVFVALPTLGVCLVDAFLYPLPRFDTFGAAAGTFLPRPFQVGHLRLVPVQPFLNMVRKARVFDERAAHRYTTQQNAHTSSRLAVR